MENITLNVEGMNCGSCENNVKTALLAYDGIVKAEASHKNKTVAVAFDAGKVTVEQIKQIIGSKGYSVTP